MMRPPGTGFLAQWADPSSWVEKAGGLGARATPDQAAAARAEAPAARLRFRPTERRVGRHRPGLGLPRPLLRVRSRPSGVPGPPSLEAGAAIARRPEKSAPARLSTAEVGRAEKSQPFQGFTSREGLT